MRSSSSQQSSTPFVGGAEQARRNARKRQSTNQNFNRKRHQNKNGLCHTTTCSPYPKSMKNNDRFFGSLLSSSTKALIQSESDASVYQAVMQRACSLLSVPGITTPAKLLSPLLKKLNNSTDPRSHHLIQRSCSFLTNVSSTASTSTYSSTYKNAREYYMAKTPLILEESRYILSESISKQAHAKRGMFAFQLELIAMEERYPNISYDLRQYAPLQLDFRITETICKDRGSSKYTRPGGVFLIYQSQLNYQSKTRRKVESKDDSSVLACIVPSYHKVNGGNSDTLSLMIFNRDGIDLRQFSDNNSEEKVEENVKLSFRAVYLATLISFQRQMDACLRQAKVPFMPKLLGQKNATHIRFNDSSDDDDDDDEEIICDVDEELQVQEGFYVNDGETNSTTEDDGDETEEGANELFALLNNLPTLNPTQERAAKGFLASHNSLHLVQGPPGTGKSTFLVNVICRRLASDSKARILVTAPTNRAVTVLAQRFLDVVNSCGADLLPNCNAILVGVEDKLLPSAGDQGCTPTDALPSSLQSIFAYTWVASIKSEYENLLKSMRRTSQSFDVLVKEATNISNKLCKGVPSAQTVIHYSWKIVRELTIALQEKDPVYGDFFVGGGPSVSPIETAINHTKHLIDAIDELDDVVPELLSTARVIFCTLSTAGASVLKQTRKINDVFIDEAACATECEIAIPFHLRPERCLAVGDPLQLPPTIMSDHAAELGLGRSMHDRLMNGCEQDFVMLDYQYRMKPEISSFPNTQFYDGKLLDGENVSRKDYSSRFSLRPEIPYSFITVPDGVEFKDSGGSYANKEECDVVVDLVEIISTLSGSTQLDEDKLRIITFYQGQVTHLKRYLAKRGFHGVTVATVDSSQGCEADVIIVSFVRSSDKKGVFHATGFLADDRRINVALTRARHQLVCVGNKNTLGLEGSQVLRNLVLDAEQRGCIV